MTPSIRDRVDSRIQAALLLVDGNVRQSGEAMALLQIAFKELSDWHAQSDSATEFDEWLVQAIGATGAQDLKLLLETETTTSDQVIAAAKQLRTVLDKLPTTRAAPTNKNRQELPTRLVVRG